MRKNYSLSIVIALFLLGVSTPAMTACNQAQIAGLWYVLVRWSDGGSETGWNDCRMRLNKQGKMQSISCVDLDLGETTTSSAPMDATGTFRLQKSCRVSGNFAGAKVRGFVDRKVLVMNGAIYEEGAANEVVTFTAAKK
jgi:hypothetical protein